jgi:HEAT repeat protein
MRCILSLITLGALVLLGDQSWARRDALTAEQKSQLERIDRVLVDVIALSDKGSLDAKPLVDVVVTRMKEFDYTTVTDPAQPHDVELKIKCEQRKTWEGTTTMGSDADLPDAPSRIWKGPACQLGYLLNGKKMAWRKEVRTDFDDAQAAATLAKTGDPAAYAMAKLQARLEEYDFPALITAEWGQEARLFRLYDDPKTPVARKVKLVALFGDLFSVKAIPRLLDGLNGADRSIAKASALALGNIGQKDTIPVLIKTMKSGPPDPLLETLNTEDVAVKTEVAWALGKLPDMRAYEPLFELQKSLYRVHENDADPNLVKLKEAVNWSIKQIDTWEHVQ